MTKNLVACSRQNIEKKVLKEASGEREHNGYTKQFRRDIYLEQQAQKEKNEEDKKKVSMFKEYNEMYADEQKKAEIPVYNLNGGIRQAN